MDELQAYLDALKGQQSMTHQAEPPPDAVQHFVQQAPAAVGAFASGGLHGLAKQQGVETPEWSQHVADFFNRPGVQDATSMLGPNLGIMAGRLAKTANMADRDLAVKMINRGYAPEQVHDATNWFAGADKHLKYEISDKDMKARSLGGNFPNGIQGSVANFIDHPELFKAYPDIKNTTVHVDPNYGPENSGEFQPWANKIILGGGAGSKGLTQEQQKTLIHELQHHVQGKEGFGQGTNSNFAYETVRDALWNKFQNMSPSHPDVETVYNALNQLQEHGRGLGYQMYKNTPGETEARNVANRFMLDTLPEYVNYRGKYPWKTEDVPRSQQFEYVKKALGK